MGAYFLPPFFAAFFLAALAAGALAFPFAVLPFAVLPLTGPNACDQLSEYCFDVPECNTVMGRQSPKDRCESARQRVLQQTRLPTPISQFF